MRDLVKMVVVLTVICGASGLVLSYVNEATKAPREYQLLKYVKEPSIKAVLPTYDNDPILDRVQLEMGKNDKGEPVHKSIFPAKEGSKVIAVAYDAATSGYGGPIEVMVGINAEGVLTGVSVMTHSETPGLGARIEEPTFNTQFKDLKIAGEVKLTAEGGKLNAVSGATISSKAVAAAVRQAMDSFPEIKKEVF